MKTIALLGGTALLVLALNGCKSPELATTPYTDTDRNWEEYLKDSYPSWAPPQTLPPVTVDGQSPAPELTTETIIDTNAPVVVVDQIDLPPPPPADTPAASETYTVQKGDSLWSISKKFYGNGSNWKRIQEANMETLSDPKKLRTGMKLHIPLAP